MFKRKCLGCNEPIEKVFNFCPYCGASIKEKKKLEDFGLLGLDDSSDQIKGELKLPMGIEKIVNSMIKQFEKQMSGAGISSQNGLPGGFNIKITTGKPQTNNQIIENNQKKEIIHISPEEMRRRMNLPKVEAESKVKRLGDKIIYEINVPGIKEKKEVTITNLANGIEIRAYSDDKCYIKIIPLKVDTLVYQVRSDKIVLEFKA